MTFSVTGKKVELELSSDSQVDSAFQYLRTFPGITDIEIRMYSFGNLLQQSVQSLLLSEVPIAEFDYNGDWTEKVSLKLNDFILIFRRLKSLQKACVIQILLNV